MGLRGRRTARIVSSYDERETLERGARRPTTGQALALRCRIVLAAAADATNEAIAAKLASYATPVGKWAVPVRREAVRRVVGRASAGQPRSISDELVEKVIVTTLARCCTR